MHTGDTHRATCTTKSFTVLTGSVSASEAEGRMPKPILRPQSLHFNVFRFSCFAALLECLNAPGMVRAGKDLTSDLTAVT